MNVPPVFGRTVSKTWTLSFSTEKKQFVYVSKMSFNILPFEYCSTIESDI